MILITGGSGFLGSHLLQQLVLRGESVRALKRNHNSIYPTGDIAKKIEWVEGNVLDIISLEDAMEGCEEVYHCAAKVSFLTQDRERIMTTNAEGTANVVNVALEKKVRKLVHVSSVAAIGKSVNGELIDEHTEWADTRQNSNYAISKYLAEREVWRGIAEGLNAVIVNPSLIVGPGNWYKGPPRFFLHVWNGLPVYTSGGAGMVAVQDVAKLMMWLMRSEVKGERFIISAEYWSFRNFFFLIADLIQKKRPYLKAPPWLMEILWREEAVRSVFVRKPPLITKESARIARQTFHFDNSKIKKMTQFEFTPIRTCLEETSKLFLEFIVKERDHNGLRKMK